MSFCRVFAGLPLQGGMGGVVDEYYGAGAVPEGKLYRLPRVDDRVAYGALVQDFYGEAKPPPASLGARKFKGLAHFGLTPFLFHVLVPFQVP